MDFMQFLKNFNQKRSIVKHNMNKCMIIKTQMNIKIRIRIKMIFNKYNINKK
jgi:hypothetical protein